MKTLIAVAHAFRDLFVQLLPIKKYSSKYSFAFIVHARNLVDIHRKYPLTRYLPDSFVRWMAKGMWPVIVSNVTGLKSLKTGKELVGLVIGFPMTARQMIENRSLALSHIIDAVELAEKMGVKIVGLGALTSSLSKGGLDVIDKTKVSISTGHAYTAFTVSKYAQEVTKIFNLQKDKIRLAIVGASGSVGSTTAKFLARDGYSNFTLFDLPHKAHFFDSLRSELLELNPSTQISTSTAIRDVKDADIIITATNATEAVIHAEDLKSGAIVIDDAQPSDVAPDALEREDALILEAGVVHTPGIDTHFNFGLKDKRDNFCCLCEIMILAANHHEGHYVINRASLEHIDKIHALGEQLGFRLAKFQNFNELISDGKIAKMKEIINSRVQL